MSAWKLAPALAAGNTCILKPSELTPLTALELGKNYHGCGMPAGVVNIITGPGAGVGEELASNPKVDKIAFTGGTVTGKNIMKAASGNIKKISLELGGKNPNIIFADADLEAASTGTFRSFCQSRRSMLGRVSILVEKSIHKKLVDGMLKKFQNKIRSRFKGWNQDGPLVSSQHRERLRAT